MIDLSNSSVRIGRLEFGVTIGPKSSWMWGFEEYNCYCKFLDLGPFFIVWLSYECMAGMYKDKARLYRVKRYLKKRKNRKSA